MLIPMPKLAGAEQKKDAYPEPDALNIDLRRQAWALSKDGSHAAAADVWREVLAARYDDADAADELGQVLVNQDKHEDAVAAFQRSLSFRPDSVATKLSLGRALLKLSRHADARYNFEDILAKNPDDVDALLGLSAALLGLKVEDAALNTATRAFELKPDYADSAFGKGEALKALKKDSEAEELFRKALALQPDHRDAAISLARLLQEDKRHRDAMAVLKTVVENHPRDLAGWGDYGAALLGASEHGQAIAAHRRAINIQPHSAQMYCNLSLALAGAGRMDEAIAACKQALAIEPNSATAQFNLSFFYLGLGRFDEGWPAYEFRLVGNDKKLREGFRAAPWCGEALEGKSILVIGEQANGDYLQFIRYLKPLAEMGASVYFVGPKRLIRLLSTLPAPVKWLDDYPKEGSFDFQISLMSIPERFNRLGLPIPTDPYLSAEPERIEYWRRRIGAEGFRIGVAWQGGVYGKTESTRSYRLENLLPLARLPGIRLISLQIGKGTEQMDKVPEGLTLETLGPDFDAGEDGFIDTAAAMVNMDLIISCDTSLVHLAGGLGRPLWIALNHSPEWRWRAEGSASYWYPNARLFRQKTRGEWDGVFQEMAQRLSRPDRGLDMPAAGPPAASAPSAPKVAVSWGEVVDKATILEIKAAKVSDPIAAANIARELSELNGALARMGPGSAEFEQHRSELRQINETLWAIEDDLRECEARQEFGGRFVELARSVYRCNDERARIKRAINALTNSAIVEEKLYADYGAPAGQAVKITR